MINKIGFISYNVSNLQQSVNFYQNLLGFELIIRHDSWAEFNVSGQRFAIHEINIGEIKSGQIGAIVYFEVNPIEIIVKKLQDKGVNFKEEIEVYPYGKLILFSDPDKNYLGLYQPPRKE
jgi:predicted enzyme related to lactoylglutathione lyase